MSGASVSGNLGMMNLTHFFGRLLTPESFPKLYHDTLLFTIVAVVLWRFRGGIGELVGRISKHKNPLGEFEFSPNPAASKFPDGTQKSEVAKLPLGPAVTNIEYYKTAHYYWLGSDLMEAVANVAFHANRDGTIGALRQSLRHFKQAGISDTEIEDRLTWLISENEKTLEPEWRKEEKRRDMLNEILVIRLKISHLINAKAGELFRPFA